MIIEKCGEAMILAFCDKSYIVEILLIVKTFFKIACYLAPVLIIIVSMIHIFKSVMSGKDEDLKDSLKVTVKRIIAGLLIAFLPALTNYIFTSLIDASEVEFLACFEAASKEKVASLKAKEEAEAEAQKKAEAKEDEAKLREAYEKEMKDKEGKRQSFEEWRKKKEEEERKQREAEQRAREQQQGGNNDGTVSGDAPVGGTTAGSSSVVSSKKPGVNVLQFNANNGVKMKYWEITPTSVQSGLPLIVFLHGVAETDSVSGVGGLPIVSYVANEWDRNGRPFVFLAPIAPSRGWSGEKLVAVKGLIDSTVSKYNIDTNHIIITGMSMGGSGTWKMLANYGSFFSAAVPMSGCSSVNSNTVQVPILAIVGGNESDYIGCMRKNVNKVNNSGGRASLDVKSGASHGTIQKYYKNVELFNWMLSQ